jgi:sirohydrochlorin ferrochelatase
LSTAIIVFAHGSTVASANDAVRSVAAAAAAQGGFEHYDVAFLDCAPPSLREAVERLAVRGARRILVMPYFLTLGIHLQRDLPAIVGQLQERYPGLEMRVTPPLDGHPALGGIIADRVREALEEWDSLPAKPR